MLLSFSWWIFFFFCWGWYWPCYNVVSIFQNMSSWFWIVLWDIKIYRKKIRSIILCSVEAFINWTKIIWAIHSFLKWNYLANSSLDKLILIFRININVVRNLCNLFMWKLQHWKWINKFGKLLLNKNCICFLLIY